MTDRPSKFCATCPRRLDSPPGSPCPLALERIHAQQAESDPKRAAEVTVGCDWAINSAEHNYCFWNMNQTLQDDPKTDREICELLGITPAVLARTWAGVLTKMRANRDSPEMREWIEAVLERAAVLSMDLTVYLPDNFSEPETDEEPDQDAAVVESEERAKTIDRSMPTHRSGKRKDVYGLYSRRTLERLRNEKGSK